LDTRSTRALRRIDMPEASSDFKPWLMRRHFCPKLAVPVAREKLR
jgi:hypothetical protein